METKKIFDLSGGKKQMKVILFMPGKLQAQISRFIQEVLELPPPILCSSVDNLALIYDSGIPTLIVSTFYRGTNRVIHEKMLGIAGRWANIIIVHPHIKMTNMTWLGRLTKAIMFFDNLYRPLRSIILVGITVPEYLNVPINCDVGRCVVLEDVVPARENIKPEFIYRYGLKDRIESFGRFYETNKRYHFRLEPDLKLTFGNGVPFNNISRAKIDFYGRLSDEIWRF